MIIILFLSVLIWYGPLLGIPIAISAMAAYAARWSYKWLLLAMGGWLLLLWSGQLILPHLWHTEGGARVAQAWKAAFLLSNMVLSVFVVIVFLVLILVSAWRSEDV
jgi:hypothetical protein